MGRAKRQWDAIRRLRPRNLFHRYGKPIRDITYHLGGNHNLPLLSPYGFTRLNNSTAGGEISVQDARSNFRSILRGFQLRRVMASQVQLQVSTVIRVGAHIPRYSITTIELAMTALRAQAYTQSARGVCVELPRAVWTLHCYAPIDGLDSIVSGSPVTDDSGINGVVPILIRRRRKRCCCASCEQDVPLPRQRHHLSSKLATGAGGLWRAVTTICLMPRLGAGFTTSRYTYTLTKSSQPSPPKTSYTLNWNSGRLLLPANHLVLTIAE